MDFATLFTNLTTKIHAKRIQYIRHSVNNLPISLLPETASTSKLGTMFIVPNLLIAHLLLVSLE